MQRLGRREFLQRAGRAAGVAAAVSLLPRGLLASAVGGQRTFGLFGLHGVPNAGGETDADLLVADLAALSARWFVSIWPREHVIRKLSEAGVRPIIRLAEEGNAFTPAHHSAALGTITRYFERPVIQPFNEVNLLRETVGKPLSAREHVREGFLPAAELIAARGGLALLTPLAQDAGAPNWSEEPYFVEMLDELSSATSIDWLREHVAIAVHSYTLGTGEDLWSRIAQVHDMTVGILGEGLPLYVTEAGLHRTESDGLDEAAVAAETVRLLDQPVPVDLPVQAVCFWLLANFAQRPEQQRRSQNRDLQHFERAAWRGVDGPRDVFRRVARYTTQQSGL